MIYIFIIHPLVVPSPVTETPSTQLSPPIFTINTDWQGLTADEIIKQHKKGKIRREFPSEFLDQPIEAIKKAADRGSRAAKKALKLLTDQRFNKTDNRK